jgi:hypothetical protein
MFKNNGFAHVHLQAIRLLSFRPLDLPLPSQPATMPPEKGSTGFPTVGAVT